MLSQYQQLLAIGLLLISFQVFAQYQQLLAEHQPDLVVKGDNYPPPGFRWQKQIFHGKYRCTYQYPMKSPESLADKGLYIIIAMLTGYSLPTSLEHWRWPCCWCSSSPSTPGLTLAMRCPSPLSPYYCPGASSYLCTKWQPQVRTIQL